VAFTDDTAGSVYTHATGQLRVPHDVTYDVTTNNPIPGVIFGYFNCMCLNVKIFHWRIFSIY